MGSTSRRKRCAALIDVERRQFLGGRNRSSGFRLVLDFIPQYLHPLLCRASYFPVSVSITHISQLDLSRANEASFGTYPSESPS